MAVRLIAGRAGSGKTHHCLTQIASMLEASLIDGPRLILLVPEQAGLQMERSLLARTRARLLGRCEVLSFRRLAHRLLSDSAAPSPVVMTPIGRQMALRYLIGRHHRALTEFARVAGRPGFVASISSSVTELLQESVSVERLESAAMDAERARHPSAPRLRDVALLYRVYLEYLGSQRVDPEGVLDLARTRMSECGMISGAHVWIDGFAGLTQQQQRMIVDLARRAAEVQIALLMDDRRAEGPPDELSLFARTEQTWAGLSRALREAGVAIEPPLLLTRDPAPRFARAELARLERNLFRDAQGDTGSRLPARTARAQGFGSSQAENVAVRYVLAPDRRAECAAAARTILDFVQAEPAPMRFRDVAVIVRDLEPYHDLLSAELAAHGIPFFIDRRRPTYHHPLVQWIRAALALLIDRRVDQAVCQMLKTGLVTVDPDEADALENYLLAHGIEDAAAWDEPWTYPPPGIDEDAPSVSDRVEAITRTARKLRERFDSWWPHQTPRNTRRSCRTWTADLYALMQRFGVAVALGSWQRRARQRGDHDEAAEHAQVWNDFVRLLDELTEILGDERLTARQFRETLESGLSQLTLGLVPSTLDQVLVGSIERSRHPPVRAVLVLGFCEGQFPARWSEDSILADEERACLEQSGLTVGRSRSARQLDERMLAYIAFTRASECLCISRPEADERGRPIEASMYDDALRAALPALTVERVDTSRAEHVGAVGELCGYLAAGARHWAEERAFPSSVRTGDAGAASESRADWAALYDWARQRDALREPLRAALCSLTSDTVTARLSPDATRALWRPPYRTNVGALERFAACPFQHFADRGLRLRPRVRHEIAAVDMGTIYHAVLQQLVNELIERDVTLADLSVDEIRDSVERLCRVVVPQYAENVRMDERQRRVATWRGRHQLPAALRGAKSTAERTRLRPRRTELTFGLEDAGALPALELTLPDGRRVLVRGRIDRLDLMPRGEDALGVVFDYKRTLGKKLSLNEVYHGLALQLLTYLLVLREHGRTPQGGRILPGGAFYIPLVAGLKRVESPTADEAASMDGYGEFQPRGIVDFDALGEIVPGWSGGGCPAFSAYRTRDGRIGYAERSDAVTAPALSALLDFVRDQLTALSVRWLEGDISVSPARLGKELPCVRCHYRGVCRFEYSGRQMRLLTSLGRTEVLNRMTSGGPGA